MNWSIVLGILGILVSIVVGWITYRFADRRSRNQKYRTAKAAVLQELSKSLGEDSIPTPAIILATMRSVLRESGDSSIDIKVDEVLDDLMRQVTADPFLDGDRRRKLQSDIEQVRREAQGLRIEHSEGERDDLKSTSLIPSFFGAVAAASTATILIGVPLEDNFGRILRVVSESGPTLLSMLALVIAGLIFLLLLMSDRNEMEKTKRFFRRRK